MYSNTKASDFWINFWKVFIIFFKFFFDEFAVCIKELCIHYINWTASKLARLHLKCGLHVQCYKNFSISIMNGISTEMIITCYRFPSDQEISYVSLHWTQHSNCSILPCEFRIEILQVLAFYKKSSLEKFNPLHQ